MVSWIPFRQTSSLLMYDSIFSDLYSFAHYCFSTLLLPTSTWILTALFCVSLIPGQCVLVFGCITYLICVIYLQLCCISVSLMTYMWTFSIPLIPGQCILVFGCITYLICVIYLQLCCISVSLMTYVWTISIQVIYHSIITHCILVSLTTYLWTFSIEFIYHSILSHLIHPVSHFFLCRVSSTCLKQYTRILNRSFML